MGSKLKFIALYFLSWIIFFDLMRLIFLLYHFDKTRSLSLPTVFKTFWYGLRMDLSVAAYLVAPICLFVGLSLFIRFFQRLTIYKIYTFLVLLVIALISLVDLEVYTSWGFRIDATPLRFLATPREALASISHLPLFFIILVFLVCYGLFYFCFRYILRVIFFQQQNTQKVLTGVVILVLMGALIIPIRGGIQQAPLNQSSVYFSTNNYANHAAINASWNFLHSAFSKGASGKNPYKYMTPQQAGTVVDSLYKVGSATEQFIQSDSSKPVNVIVVIWESFTEKATAITVGKKEVTPEFNRLKKEGIYFSNIYATGDRTNKGVPAILSGYPSMPNTTIIHTPGKSAKLQVLSLLFKMRGYVTPFFYGGEPEFANIKSYLLHAGFDPIVGKNDFSSKDMNSKWGAHDGVVMTRVLKDLNASKKPFFATWLTLSSHEPFETPVPTVFQGSDNTSKFLNSIHYTDAVLGDFIRQCSKEEWWSNTVVVIVGDHGHPLPETGNRADDFRTPMLWLGGALSGRGSAIDKIYSQVDIASTLAAQFKMPEKEFPFSKNILDPSTRSWAYFSFNDGFGFVDSTGAIVFDNVGKRMIQSEGEPGAAEVEAGKALQQYIFQDFLNK